MVESWTGVRCRSTARCLLLLVRCSAGSLSAGSRSRKLLSVVAGVNDHVDRANNGTFLAGRRARGRARYVYRRGVLRTDISR
jgi:hypothetical protein